MPAVPDGYVFKVTDVEGVRALRAKINECEKSKQSWLAAGQSDIAARQQLMIAGYNAVITAGVRGLTATDIKDALRHTGSPSHKHVLSAFDEIKPLLEELSSNEYGVVR